MLDKDVQSRSSFGLIAIDGTDSANIMAVNVPKISHVFHFYQAFQVREEFKTFLHGPQYAKTGWDARRIAYQAAEQAKQIHLKIRNFGVNNPQICLVGWSRGAMIAIRVARLLQGTGEVYFMGLWDTVDMSPTLDVEPVVNVKHVFHAKRSLKGSRQYSMRERHSLSLVRKGKVLAASFDWRNNSHPTSGRYMESTNQEAYFETSHGGLGGALEKWKPEDYTADYTPWVDEATLSMARREEGEAYNWIRQSAQNLGVPVQY